MKYSRILVLQVRGSEQFLEVSVKSLEIFKIFGASLFHQPYITIYRGYQCKYNVWCIRPKGWLTGTSTLIPFLYRPIPPLIFPFNPQAAGNGVASSPNNVLLRPKDHSFFTVVGDASYIVSNCGSGRGSLTAIIFASSCSSHPSEARSHV